MNKPSNKSLVSVIIPTFNRAKIIPISIKSVLKQSYTNIEILIVDDASKDNTEEVVRSIDDSRIHYIQLPSNGGGAVARNKGIDNANGDYIAFLDSDDVWLPEKIETQLNFIEKQEKPNNTVSYTQVIHSPSGISEDIYNSLEKQVCIPQLGKPVDEPLSEYLFCRQGKTLTSTLMLPQSLASKTRFSDNLRKHQDWDFCLRLEANGADFAFLQTPLTIWNGDPSFEHVGRQANYRLSENWLSQCQPYLSKKAAAAFALNKILPSLMEQKERKVYAQSIIFGAYAQKIIDFKRLGKLSGKLWFANI